MQRRILFTLCLLLAGNRALADDNGHGEAGRLYTQGQRKFQENKISEAIGAFRQSGSLYPNPLTSYNIGNCELILGHRTRARLAFDQALMDNPRFRPPATLDAGEVQRAQQLLSEIDRQLSMVEIVVDPADAAIAIDGAPLLVTAPDRTPPVLMAGVLPQGRGQPPPRGSFLLIVDAGAHRLTLSRKGFKDVDLYHSFEPTDPAQKPQQLHLPLDLLPARVHITANQAAAIATVNGDDVGPTPAHLDRPAGRYVVVVKKKGFLPFEAPLTVQAGEEATLRANLLLYKPPFYKKWWFWTGAALAAGAVVGITLGLTYGLRDDRSLLVFGTQ